MFGDPEESNKENKTKQKLFKTKAKNARILLETIRRKN